MQAYVRLDPVDQTVALTSVDVPVLDLDEVLVAVQAFGGGVHDRYFIPPRVSFPYPIGLEAAGIVTAVGAEVTGVTVRDRVIVTSVGNLKGGTWAEFVAVDPRDITAIPDALDFGRAAGIPIAGDAAVESMHTLGMTAGETLFVAGASGAIGTLVVQLAAQQGVRGAGSASAPHHPTCCRWELNSLCTTGIPSGRAGSPLGAQRRGRHSGDPTRYAGIEPGVRDGGHLVTVSGDPCPPQRGIRVEQFPHRADPRKDMATLVGDISTGRISLVLEQVYPFDQALAALAKTETRHARGKLVVQVR